MADIDWIERIAKASGVQRDVVEAVADSIFSENGEKYVRVKEHRFAEMLDSELEAAFSAGCRKDDEWWAGGMADAEWLARVIGANERGWNNVSDVMRRIGYYRAEQLKAASPKGGK